MMKLLKYWQKLNNFKKLTFNEDFEGPIDIFTNELKFANGKIIYQKIIY